MRRRAFALAVTAALLLSGCALPAGRSGGSDATVAAKLGTPDIAGRPSALIISAFQGEIESETGGRIRIEPEWQAAGADPSDDEIARDVASGAVEFGVVPARGWDLLGVESLMPLQLPGLIVTDAAAAAVATDPVADELLSGLEEVGVTGLALVPDGIRRLFVVPPETPENFAPQGAGIRSMNSKASEELFQLVGATTTEASGIDLDADILSGDVTAVETSWNLLDNLSVAVSAVGDVPLFTKFEVIAVNSEWFASRSESERAAIRVAAQAAAERVIVGTTPDVEQAEAFCSAGGTIEPASADDRECLRRRPRDTGASPPCRLRRVRAHRSPGPGRRGDSRGRVDPVLLAGRPCAGAGEHRPRTGPVPRRDLSHGCLPRGADGRRNAPGRRGQPRRHLDAHL